MTRNFEIGDYVSIFVEERNERLTGSLMSYSLDGLTANVKTKFGPFWGFANTLAGDKDPIPWWYWTIRPLELDDYLEYKKRTTVRASMLAYAMIMGEF